jgi:hypothetical protein
MCCSGLCCSHPTAVVSRGCQLYMVMMPPCLMHCHPRSGGYHTAVWVLMAHAHLHSTNPSYTGRIHGAAGSPAPAARRVSPAPSPPRRQHPLQLPTPTRL